MPEREVRYCTTEDGVRIAYCAEGEGPPLVRALGWFTHLELEERSPIWQVFNELEKHFTVVRYDGRGVGLSDRDVTDFSTHAKLKDLEAVIGTLKLRRFALLGTSEGGATAITYALRYPKKVTRLVLYGSFARAPLGNRERREAMLTLMRTGWDQQSPALRQMFTGLFIPEADGDQIRMFNEFQRASASAREAVAFMSALAEIDVGSLCQQVSTPTLVIHRREEGLIPFERGRQLAALIPGARLLGIEGKNHIPLAQEPEFHQIVRAIVDFAGGKRAVGADEAGQEAGLITVLFTDLVGHTEMMQRLGDEQGRVLLREHERITRDVLKQHGGTEVKTMGDGFMASFASVTKAVECAVALQRAFEGWNAQGEHAGSPLRIRVGLNAGEPIAEEGDLFGSTVILASRVCAQAGPGEVLIPEPVRHLLSGKEFLFSDRGEFLPKGFEDAVRLYEVRWRAANA